MEDRSRQDGSKPPGWESVSKALQRPAHKPIVLLDGADSSLLLLEARQIEQLEVRPAPDAVYRLIGGDLRVQGGTVAEVRGDRLGWVNNSVNP